MRHILLASLCVLSLHAVPANAVPANAVPANDVPANDVPVESPNKDRIVRYDERNDYAGSHFDYAAMMQYSAQKFEQFAERIQAFVASQNDEGITLTNEDEQTDFVIAYGYFLIALFRMRQEAACIIDENAASIPSAVWGSMGPLFSIFPKDLQIEALGEIIEYIQDNGNDEWAATERLELYKPSSEWAALRAEVSDNFVQFLKDIAKTLQ